MNRTKLKNYAPQARRDFIQAMTDRAAYFGLTAKKTEPVVEKGDVAVIGGRSFPVAVAKKRKALEDRIKRYGFEQTMEAMAYTWFNRLVAIRFMELHGYLDHGYRVLSHPEGKPTPEILEHAEHVELPGLKKEVVIDLKLAGNKEGELYRLLLTAQCNALHTAMPFLFERIDDETELLLPDNLLNSDSLMRKLVGEIEEEDWSEVEIIGWLYQFYISEKKDEVIGKVVASEDIPAATQLFTPNWIVKYLVQNTLGRQWLATYPQSALRQQMEYYIEPAEQTPEVQEQLKAITPTSLNPEELTLLDPACGSGHILVEAYDLFKAIYQERGYRAKDIPALILQKNLFGMEIDDRAAQLAAFALMMKARADDRRVFDSESKPNILAFEDSQGMNATEIAYALNAPINKDDVPNEYLFEEIQEEKDGLFSKKALAEKGHVSQVDIAALLELFENAKTFGSLIQVPPKLASKLSEIEKRLEDVLTNGDLTHASAHVLKPLLQQAQLLARQYDAVVANPPYMGTNGMNSSLKMFAAEHYPAGKADLFAIFIDRCQGFLSDTGHTAMITMHGWMFLTSFKELRTRILESNTIVAVAHLGPRAFATISGQVVQTCAFTNRKSFLPGFRPTFFRLIEGGEDEKNEAILARRRRYTEFLQSEFSTLPGQPIAYWLSRKAFAAFSGQKVSDLAESGGRCKTHSDEKYVRFEWEVSRNDIGDGRKWKHYEKGGKTRKYYGNRQFVVDWTESARSFYAEHGGLSNPRYWSREGLCWSDISAGAGGFRIKEANAEFGSKSPTLMFQSGKCNLHLLAFLNSPVATHFLEVINPSFQINVGDVLKLPVVQCNQSDQQAVISRTVKAIEIARLDWTSREEAFEFQRHPSLDHRTNLLREAWCESENEGNRRWEEIRQLEGLNNSFFLDQYQLSGELSPDVSDDQITLYRPDREEDNKRLLSYAIGSMMGRYSLDDPGLIYAQGGNQGFDASRYQSFRADDDGIIPLLEADWGIHDDATNRFAEFVSVAWPKEHLEENLKFVADSLGLTGSEQPRDTIRRYLSTGFYKHHLSMYKKRPIYWLFSSGKQRAFQCLVYLHRYHEGTLARMRTEYVIPLQGQIAARIEQLEGDKSKATSTSHRNKLQKEQTDLKKQQAELLIFEEKLKHAADQKISLDLDDGVKVNYAKFGDLLAESKAITGGKEEE